MSARAPAFVFLAAVALVAGRTAADPEGMALAFQSVRVGTCLFEPRVDIGRIELAIQAGDALEYDMLLPVACAEHAGPELVFADGRRSSAPEVAASDAWQHVRVPLDAFAGATLAHVELVARGKLAADIGYRVDDVAVVHGDQSAPAVIFGEMLPAGSRIARDDARNAGAMVVPRASEWDGVHTRLADEPLAKPLSDRWYAYDLTRLSNSTNSGKATGAADVAGPRGSLLAGPCVPFRFTSSGSSTFVRASGQRLAFEPVEGGRFYSVWIAASLDEGPAITTRAFAYGDMGERRVLEFTVPAAGDPGAVDLGGCTLIEIPVASLVPLKGIQLPDEPRLRVHALTFQWRREGALDSRFRLDWLEHEARFGNALDPALRTELARYVDDRTIGPIFAETAEDEQEAERAIFDAAVSGNAAFVDEQVKERVKKHVAIGAPLKSLRIAFEKGGDDRGALHVPAGGIVTAEELARAVSKLPAGRAVVIDGDPAELRQAPQLLRSAGVDVALIDSESPLATWSGPDGSSVQLVGTSRPIADAREIAELPWHAWIERVRSGKTIPEIFVPVDANETARAGANAIVALLSRVDVAPSVQSATAEEFAAQAVARLGKAEPKFAPGDLRPMDEGAVDADSIVRRRRTVAAIGVLETFATIAHADGAPAIDARIDALWAAVSSSHTLGGARALLGDQLGVLARGATTLGAGTPIVAFNTVPWPRTTLVRLDAPGSRVLGSDEKERPAQPAADGGTLFAVDVPSLGYEVVHAVRTRGSTAAVTVRAPVTVTEWTARNDAIAFTIDPASGALTSLKVLGDDTEMLSAPARLTGEGWTVKSADFVERGPLRAIARLQLESPAAHATVDFVLETRARCVEVRCALDAVDRSANLAFSVPLRHAAARAIAGVPFGSSPAAPLADGSAARLGLLDWVAGTDGTNGAAVLAEECAAVRLAAGRIDVEMLAPIEPARARTTTFALAPFSDGWKKAGLAQRAQELAMPVELFVTDAHAGARDPRHSFVSLARVDKDASLVQGADTGPMLSSLRAGAEGEWVIRVVETSDRAQDVLVETDRPVFEARRVDVRGASIGTLHSERHRALLPLGARRIENVVLRSRP